MSIFDSARALFNRYTQTEPRKPTAEKALEHLSASRSPSSQNTPAPGQKLLARLLSAKLNDSKIARLARTGNNKELVLEAISWLNASFKGGVISAALDSSTPLGRFFAVKRGWFPTSDRRGTLASLKVMQARFTAYSQWIAQDMTLSFLSMFTADLSIPKIPRPEIDIIGALKKVETPGASQCAGLETHLQELPLALPKENSLRGSYAQMEPVLLDRPQLSEPAMVMSAQPSHGIPGLSFLKIQKTGMSPSCDTSTSISNNPF
ncbi:hypothetical protein [Legionella sp. CNM-4043-24]|uniref:hypothetical protein n=1 Tax=Legionella sp. CNM-4043-24 TaxID=3421646 RepID=UPI00403AB2F5